MPEQRILISHEDGRRYSVTQRVFEDRYRDLGFVAGEAERPADFIANVPRPPRRAGARRKTTKPAKPAKVSRETPAADTRADLPRDAAQD